MNLRDYQVKVVKEVYDLIRKGEKRILIVAPTGAGKTTIAAQIVAHAYSRNVNAMFCVNYDVLVAQTSETFQRWNIPHGFIKAGYDEVRDATVQIASVQTLPRRSWWHTHFIPKIIILDEAHITAWNKIVDQLLEDYPDAIIIGLTATPYRLSKKQSMADKFNALVAAPFPSELMEQGHLVHPVYYSVKGGDISKVKIIAGDYAEDELALVMNDPEVLNALVDNWQRLANDRITIIFAVNVEHSKAIARTFQDRGINIIHVDGSTPIPERERIYKALANEEINGIVSCQVTQIGFDCPRVDCVVLDRHTKSAAIFYQQIGRGLRPHAKKKDCLVLDQTGNIMRFTPVELVNQYSLVKPPPGEGEAWMKECPECGHTVYGFIMECPKCGYKFPAKEKEKEKPTGELKRVKFDKNRVFNNEEKKQALQLMVKGCFNKRQKPGSTYYQYTEKFNGQKPPDVYYLHAIFGDNPSDEQKEMYWKFLVNKYKDKMSDAQKWYRKEFGEERLVKVLLHQ
jgi:superfamily II DNA or RNA helicase